jgi:hypothetical protein
VADFCTKCGAALTPGVQFCTSCGAAAGAAAGFPAAPAQPPAYGQPLAYGQPAAPVQPASNNAVKIIIIVIGAVIGIGLLSVIVFMFSVWRLSKAVRVNSGGDGVTLSTPSGTISTGSASAVSAADLGVPIYPGATRREGGMQINSANGSMVTVVFSTSDPVSKVVDFYQGKVGDNASVIQTGNSAIISAGTRGKDGVVITVSSDTSSSNGGTKIAIMRTKTK